MNIQDFFMLGMKREVSELIPNNDGCAVLNLGGGRTQIGKSINLQLPEWDANKDKIPFQDDSVDQVHMYHLIEHLNNPVRVFIEIQRVLKTGGHCNIVVPYYLGAMSYQDITHTKHFSINYLNILFANDYYDTSYGLNHEWKFKINFNMVLGITDANLAIFSQIIKTN